MNLIRMNFAKISFIFLFIMLFAPSLAFGEMQYNFYTEAGFTKDDKNELAATLISSPDNLHLYIETSFWESKNDKEQKEIKEKLNVLSKEFNEVIYPKLTSTFGKEANMGVDKDSRITIFFHETKNGVNGYVKNIDAYEKSINPFSNQRKLIYMSTDLFSKDFLKETLAHEFVHLITLNNKDVKYGVVEDRWLNEARAEYAVTFLGYNQEGDYVKERIRAFLERPYVSLTEWQGNIYDYGIINSFVHYLVDHYSVKLLVDSLKSSKKGVESIDDFLLNNGYKDRFSDIFINWTIAVQINDCSIGEKYCFKDENFKKNTILPFSNYLPFSEESTLYTGQTLKNYSANWQRFVGGKGELNVKISNPSGVITKIPYIIKTVLGKIEVGFINLSNQETELAISNFGKDINYVIIIPIATDKNMSASNGESYFYSLTVQTLVKENQDSLSDNDIKLPFEIDKPLSQMNKEELLMLLIRVIIYLLVQGKTIV